MFNQGKSFLGLDINEISLKLIQFSKAGEKRIVQAYSETLVPKEIFSGEKIQNPKSLSKILKESLSSPKFGKVTSSYAVASVPETKSFVRVIEMPLLTEEEAKEAVPWEAENYIPLPINQVYLDWVILKEQRGERKMMVLITACPKDYINDLITVLKEAELKPLALETESQATVRSLISSQDPERAVMIADLDTIRTSLIVYDKGTLQFSFSLPIAGNVFTENIARTLGIPAEKAEEIKRQFGIDENFEAGKVKKALLPALNNILAEIKNTIRFYEEHSEKDRKIERLLLVGGSSRLKHLPSFLQERLSQGERNEHPLRSLPGIKVELGNPWINILRRGQTPPLSREESLGYATAIGLALREGE